MKLKYIALVLISVALNAEAQTQAPRRRATRPATRPTARPVARPQAPPQQEAPLDIVPEFNEQPMLERSLNALGDIVFIAPYHTFVAGLSYINSSSKTDITYLGNNYSKTSGSLNLINYELGFGLFRNIAVGVSGGYASSSTSDSTGGIASGISNGVTVKTTSSGFSEPTFKGTYRLLNQDESSVNLDFGLGYSPAVENAKSATAQSQGNYMRGGDEISVRADIAKKISIFEIAGSAEFTQNGKTTSESAQGGGGIQSKTDAFGEMSYQLGGRLELGAHIFLTGTMQYRSIPSRSGTQGSGTITTSDAYSYLGYTVGGDYEVRRNFMVLRALYVTIPTLDNSSTSAGQKMDAKSSVSGFAGQIVMQF